MKTPYPIPHTPYPKGFTLVELIVSISIITIFGVILLVKHNQFGGSVALNNLAYEVGLAIREAQVFGISVREQAAGEFDYAYGVRFHMSTPTEFISFVDINGNGKYQSASNDPNEVVEVYGITKGNAIADMCVLVGGSPKCHSSGELNAVHVTFLRPEPDANFITSPSYPLASEVDIYLRSPKGLEKIVSVNSTGQIVIK